MVGTDHENGTSVKRFKSKASVIPVTSVIQSGGPVMSVPTRVESVTFVNEGVRVVRVDVVDLAQLQLMGMT